MINSIPIDAGVAMPELLASLKNAEGYLACEKIIIQCIKKHADSGGSDVDMEKYLEKLSGYIENLIAANQGRYDCTNYRFAGGFLNILLRTPCWKNWVKTIDI